MKYNFSAIDVRPIACKCRILLEHSVRCHVFCAAPLNSPGHRTEQQNIAESMDTIFTGFHALCETVGVTSFEGRYNGCPRCIAVDVKTAGGSFKVREEPATALSGCSPCFTNIDSLLLVSACIRDTSGFSIRGTLNAQEI